MKKVILVAARKGDIKILRCLLEYDISIVFSIMNQAVDEGLTSLFEVALLHYNTMSTRVIFLSYLAEISIANDRWKLANVDTHSMLKG